jgi:hypothetical protein
MRGRAARRPLASVRRGGHPVRIMAYISAADVSQSFETIFNQPPEALEAMHTYLKVGD